MEVSFIDGRNRSTWRKPQTCCCIEYIMPRTGFYLTTFVVIGTGYKGSCKSNYHTITTTTVPVCVQRILFWTIDGWIGGYIDRMTREIQYYLRRVKLYKYQAFYKVIKHLNTSFVFIQKKSQSGTRYTVYTVIRWDGFVV